VGASISEFLFGIGQLPELRRFMCAALRRSSSHLLVSALLFLAAAGCSAERAENPPPERLILVTIDTLRADHLGSYGAEEAHTRTLDTVAREGVRFDAAIAPTPLTLPSHASLMTGLDPPGHGVRHNAIYRLDPTLPTLAGRLRERGYATAAVVGALVLDRRFGLDNGFDHYDDDRGDRMSDRVGFAERPADAVVDAALAWLADAPDRFFLWVHFYDPHARYDPPPGFAAAFARRPYAGEIAFVDSQLGRLLDAVDHRWPDGRTLVAVTSDHGESLGEHGERTHAYTLYDATQRVPLLLRGPGLPAGRVIAEPVRLVDVAPTLLSRADASAIDGVDGRDLGPLISGGVTTPRAAYSETVATYLDYGWSPVFALRTAGHRYIRAPRPELYDLLSDPGETHNIAALDPGRVAELDAVLERRLGAPRRSGEAAPVALGSADRERLRALGYAVPAAAEVDLDFRAATGADPKDEIGLLGEIEAAQREIDAGHLDAALARLALIAGGGTAVPALRAAVAIGAGDPVVAERDARAVLERQPGRSDLWIVMGRARAAQGELAAAAEAFERALALEPEQPEARRWLERVRAGMAGAADGGGSG
jgi:choline-sulfatase